MERSKAKRPPEEPDQRKTRFCLARRAGRAISSSVLAKSPDQMIRKGNNRGVAIDRAAIACGTREGLATPNSYQSPRTCIREAKTILGMIVNGEKTGAGHHSRLAANGSFHRPPDGESNVKIRRQIKSRRTVICVEKCSSVRIGNDLRYRRRRGDFI